MVRSISFFVMFPLSGYLYWPVASTTIAPGRVDLVVSADVEKAVTTEIKRLLDSGVKPEEVERAQNQLLAGAIYAQDSLASGPRIYGTMLSTGGTVADVDAWPQRISAVTPAEIQAAAEHVWRNDGAVTAMLTPAEGSR